MSSSFSYCLLLFVVLLCHSPPERDMLLLSFVEGEGFELMAFVKPDYKLPSWQKTPQSGEDV